MQSGDTSKTERMGFLVKHKRDNSIKFLKLNTTGFISNLLTPNSIRGQQKILFELFGCQQNTLVGLEVVVGLVQI